jgi:hypothetical protein
MQTEKTQTPYPRAALVKRQDSVTEKLTTAVAIVDCIRILTALERMPSPASSHDNGAGFANGNRLRDDSMPIALHHAMTLIDEALDASDHVFKVAIQDCFGMCAGSAKGGAV